MERQGYCRYMKLSRIVMLVGGPMKRKCLRSDEYSSGISPLFLSVRPWWWLHFQRKVTKGREKSYYWQLRVRDLFSQFSSHPSQQNFIRVSQTLVCLTVICRTCEEWRFLDLNPRDSGSAALVWWLFLPLRAPQVILMEVVSGLHFEKV